MFALFALRFLLIALSSGDGATGGLFIPMLSLGALVGGLTAKLCVAMGMSESYAPLTVLLCTVSFLGAATKSPVTAIVLAVETTWQFTNLFFAAAAVFTAYFVMSLLRGESAYESMLKNMLKKSIRIKPAALPTLKSSCAADVSRRANPFPTCSSPSTSFRGGFFRGKGRGGVPRQRTRPARGG